MDLSDVGVTRNGVYIQTMDLSDVSVTRDGVFIQTMDLSDVSTTRDGVYIQTRTSLTLVYHVIAYNPDYGPL
jgi:hypothetical protein